MGDYPPRVTKSENIYKLWDTGEGDMGELAIGLYDLTAHFKVIWDENESLRAEIESDNAELLECVIEEAKMKDEIKNLRKLLNINAYDNKTIDEWLREQE